MNSANTRKLMELEKKYDGHPMYIDALPAMVSFAQVVVHVFIYNCTLDSLFGMSYFIVYRVQEECQDQ